MGHDSAADAVYKKYLSDKGDPEKKITELIFLANQDIDRKNLPEGLRKLQVALLLSARIENPGLPVFELYNYTASAVGSISKGHALQFLKYATLLAERSDAIPASRLFDLYTNSAGSHQYLMEYDSARFYYYKAIQAAKLDNHVSEASTYNNLGFFYAARNMPDSARIAYQKALHVLGDKSEHLELYASIKENIAQLDFLAGMYEEAFHTYLMIDSIYIALDLPDDYLTNKVRMLGALEKLNDPGVSRMINELNEYVVKEGSVLADERVLEFYRFANDYYFNRSDYQNQIFYRARYRSLNEKVNQKKIAHMDQLATALLSIQESGFRSEIDAYNLREENQKVELKLTRIITLAATFFLLLIILFLVYYIRQRRFEHQASKKMVEAELQRKEMQARLVQQELELKKHDLTNVVLHNTQVFDANQKIITKLQEARKQKADMDDHIRSLLVELQSANQVSERSIGIQSKIDSVNTEFYEKLKTRFPALTKTESELCGYIRINLSNKDISILKNVESSSVKMGKNRLRKKLGLSPEEDLYQFIREI